MFVMRENFIQEPTSDISEIVVDTDGLVVPNSGTETQAFESNTVQSDTNPETRDSDAGDPAAWAVIAGLLTISALPYAVRAVRKRLNR